MDLTAARSFMASHARTLDRRRFDLIDPEGHPDPPAAFAAVDAYRNSDGGYGWGLEPDLRSPESQPGGALHAFEAMADAAPATTPHARELCEWLQAATLPDGGLPFARPVTDAAAVAPFWASADANKSSLQITAYVAAAAYRVAAHDRSVAEHPWLATATRYCLGAIASLGDDPHALVIVAALQLADAVYDEHPEALDRLGGLIPASGHMHVAGGKPDETMRPLDFAPQPGRPARDHVADDAIAQDLERLAGEQQDDGGWAVDFRSYSPAAALEWRGHATVRAVQTLRANGVS
jgi:hypothetical protein